MKFIWIFNPCRNTIIKNYAASNMLLVITWPPWWRGSLWMCGRRAWSFDVVWGPRWTLTCPWGLSLSDLDGTVISAIVAVFGLAGLEDLGDAGETTDDVLRARVRPGLTGSI